MEKPHECPFCEMRFQGELGLKRHTKIHMKQLEGRSVGGGDLDARQGAGDLALRPGEGAGDLAVMPGVGDLAVRPGAVVGDLVMRPGAEKGR